MFTSVCLQVYEFKTTTIDMKELKNNDKVKLSGGLEATVVKELGRGGQGIVYLVELLGKKMALKWYINAPGDKFYRNLEENVKKGAPSDAFLWPEYITTKQKGSYGYIMPLRPEGYYEFGQFYLARVQFKSFEALLNAAMKICDGFKQLHLHGLSYQDLNDGNFFINPSTGDVLICDNDNVMPDGEVSGILGKARYMAPEIVLGKTMPNKESDRFSLAVLLFMLFYGNHPFEGDRVLQCPCMTEKFEKQFYGEEILFLYNEKDTSNRPVRGVHRNVIRRWPVYPEVLRNAFINEFTQEKLKDPSKRSIERKWQDVIRSLRDMLVVCPKCKEETFLTDPKAPKCMGCGAAIPVAGGIEFSGRTVWLTPGTIFYMGYDNTPTARIVTVPGDRYPVQIQNMTSDKWTVETPSGKLKAIEPQDTMPVKAGLKVSFDSKNKAIII